MNLSSDAVHQATEDLYRTETSRQLVLTPREARLAAD